VDAISCFVANSKLNNKKNMLLCFIKVSFDKADTRLSGIQLGYKEKGMLCLKQHLPVVAKLGRKKTWHAFSSDTPRCVPKRTHAALLTVTHHTM
jgi:hypothetical protein